MRENVWKFQYESNRARYQEWLLKTTVAARDLVQFVKVTPGTSRKKRLTMLALNELLEKAESIGVLARAESAPGIDVIARSAFENFIDLKNLHRHPKEYVDYMMYLSEEQSANGLRVYIANPDKEYAQSIIKGLPDQLGITIDQAYEMTIEDRNDFRSNLTRNFFHSGRHHSEPGAKVNTSVAFRARLAGETDLYNSAYKLLSHHVHGNVKSMLGGVIDGNEFRWPPNPKRVSLMALSLMTDMLLDGALMVAKQLRKPVNQLYAIKKDRDRYSSRAH